MCDVKRVLVCCVYSNMYCAYLLCVIANVFCVIPDLRVLCVYTCVCVCVCVQLQINWCCVKKWPGA